LEALRDSAADDTVRETLLDALQHDANPGVRVEAVNLLVRSLEGEMPDMPGVPGVPVIPQIAAPSTGASVERVVHALEEMERRDSNRYVRLRSAAALRQIGPRDLQ
jgi:hypothetical protein